MPGPSDEVSAHISYARSTANNAYEDTIDYIEQMKELLATTLAVPSVGAVPDISSTPPSAISYPERPDEPLLDLSLPVFPEYGGVADIPDLDDIVAPTFTATEPTISLPGEPGGLTAVAPTSPDVETDFTYPDAPSTALPALPTFRDLDLPEIPDVTYETFEQALPVLNGSILPTNSFGFNELVYDSDLLDGISTKLVDMLSNSTGITPEVETKIWNRARDREEQELARTLDSLLIENPQRGFASPPGALMKRIREATFEAQQKINSLSRDIAIKQAELEQENLKTTISHAITLEQNLIGYASTRQARVLEAAQYANEAGFKAFNAVVSKFNAEIDSYKAYASAFESKIRAQLSKVEIYKAQLEGQQIISSLNEQDLKVYLGQLDAIRTESETYKTNVSAISERVRAESLKIENFKALVDAYSAQVQAKLGEYEMYSKNIDAKLAPLKIYSEQADVFAKRVQAYATEVDAEKSKANSAIAEETLKVEAYKATLAGVSGQTDAILASYAKQVDHYRALSAMYSSEVSAEASRYQAESSFYSADAQVKATQGQLELQKSQIAITRATTLLDLTGKILQAQSAVAAQLAAAALSSLNIGASISGNDSTNTNYNYSY